MEGIISTILESIILLLILILFVKKGFFEDN
jgi:hypothetical protein